MPISRFPGALGLDERSGQINHPGPTGTMHQLFGLGDQPLPGVTPGPTGTNGDLGAAVAGGMLSLTEVQPFLEVVWLREGSLIDEWIPQAKGLRPGYTRSVEIEYTWGKNCGSWSRDASLGDELTKGVMVDATIRDSPYQHLYGKVAIDIRKHMISNTLSASSLRQATTYTRSLEEVRKALFSTLVHELFHVVQVWLLGDKKELYSRTEKYRGGFEKYVRNPYEQAAQLIAEALSKDLLQNVARGDFDSVLPKKSLNLLFPPPK